MFYAVEARRRYVVNAYGLTPHYGADALQAGRWIMTSGIKRTRCASAGLGSRATCTTRPWHRRVCAHGINQDTRR